MILPSNWPLGTTYDPLPLTLLSDVDPQFSKAKAAIRWVVVLNFVKSSVRYRWNRAHFLNVRTVSLLRGRTS
jgi:hypothetical protein